MDDNLWYACLCKAMSELSAGRAITFAIVISACGGSAAPRAPSDAGVEPEYLVETPHRAGTELERCAEAGSGSADSIADVIAQLNALPDPSVPCLVASLPRPFGVVASSSLLSAQPAESEASPRIFVMQPGMVLTVVPDGEGASAVELGQWVTPTRTLKAEVKFPLTLPIDDTAVYAHILYWEEQTVCAQCHRKEERSEHGRRTFVSEALRPDPSTYVSLLALRREHEACVLTEDASDRCNLYHALFDFGDVAAAEFSPEVRVFGVR
ncbi:MAG: hypothetical protein RL385_1389 [Pseudomonadota bacterium]